MSRSSRGSSVRNSSLVRVQSSSSRRVQVNSAAPAQAATAPATAAQVDAAAFEEFLLHTQKQILAEAEQLDGSGKTFVQDRWERPGDNAGGNTPTPTCMPALNCTSNLGPHLLFILLHRSTSAHTYHRHCTCVSAAMAVVLSPVHTQVTASPVSWRMATCWRRLQQTSVSCAAPSVQPGHKP